LSALLPMMLLAAALPRMYRLLGAYHGLSESLIDLAEQAGRVGWSQMREARF